jgi:hypothetical protein
VASEVLHLIFGEKISDCVDRVYCMQFLLSNSDMMQVCSWSAIRSLKGDFIPGTQLRLSNYSQLVQTGISVQRKSALRTIKGNVFLCKASLTHDLNIKCPLYHLCKHRASYLSIILQVICCY